MKLFSQNCFACIFLRSSFYMNGNSVIFLVHTCSSHPELLRVGALCETWSEILLLILFCRYISILHEIRLITAQEHNYDPIESKHCACHNTIDISVKQRTRNIKKFRQYVIVLPKIIYIVPVTICIIFFILVIFAGAGP